jgi:uncharacterized delta-60 repeat protein
VALAGAGALAAVASANHGALDPFFGTQGPVLGGGITTTDLPGGAEQAEDVLGLPDGKVVAGGTAGGFAVARYKSNGRLDTTWSGDGVAVVGAAGGRVHALGAGNLIPLIAAGTSPISAQTGKVAIVRRFDASGAVDTAFGAGGAAVVTFGANEDAVAQALAVDAPPPATPTSPSLNPLVAIAGFHGASTPAGAKEAFVAQMDRLGNFTGLDGDGKILLSHVEGPTSIDQATDIAYRSGTGRTLVVVGSSQIPGSNARSWVRVIKQDGTPDTSFGGGDGIVSGTFGCSVNNPVILMSVLIDPSGRIVAAGLCGGSSAIVTRLLADGTPDVTFSGDGTAIVPGPSGATIALNDILRQADGTLVGAGSSRSSNKTKFAILSLTDAGNVNTAFGAGGFVVTDPPGAFLSEAKAITTVADGNLVAGGRGQIAGENVILVKYHAKRDAAPPTGSLRVLDATLEGGLARGALRVRLTASEPVSGTVRVRLASGSAVLARVEVPIAAARRRVVRVPLTTAGRALLGGRDAARLVVIARVEDVAGKSATFRRTAALG